jgi:rhodanese-related sulfurtransferase
MKPSADQLARLKAYYEAKVSSEFEINAVKKKVEEGKGVFVVLDARSRDAFLAGHIRGALSVPLEQAAAAAKVLPVERQYVTYCWGHT